MQAESGLTLSPHQVIIRPLLDGKRVHRASRANQYSFEVHPSATKTDIRAAIEDLFNVKVERVTTQNRLASGDGISIARVSRKCGRKHCNLEFRTQAGLL